MTMSVECVRGRSKEVTPTILCDSENDSHTLKSRQDFHQSGVGYSIHGMQPGKAGQQASQLTDAEQGLTSCQ